MPSRTTVVLSQGQSLNPAKRGLEEEIVARLLGEPGVDVTVIPHLYNLQSDGTGVLCLQGITGDMIIFSWLFPRATRWILDRHGVHGHEGTTLLSAEDDSDDDDEETDEQDSDAADEDVKQRVFETRTVPDRHIYCLDLRARESAQDYIDEVKRIVTESRTSIVELTSWIGGTPRPDQMERYLNPSSGTTDTLDVATDTSAAPPAEVVRLEDEVSRRWYPVIDYSRCTNCMECIDFCLFGVYGVDNLETILVEQPDNCRKGCPACSRVCPENAIIFPQHKTPAIAGSAGVVGGLKIDLSKLFGQPDEDPLNAAVRERDEQLMLAGRDAVGTSTGIPRRQTEKPEAARNELDDLIDSVDALDL